MTDRTDRLYEGAETYTDARQKGMRAYLDGKPLDENPFDRYTKLYNGWRDGWYDAEAGERPIREDVMTEKKLRKIIRKEIIRESYEGEVKAAIQGYQDGLRKDIDFRKDQWIGDAAAAYDFGYEFAEIELDKAAGAGVPRYKVVDREIEKIERGEYPEELKDPSNWKNR